MNPTKNTPYSEEGEFKFVERLSSSDERSIVIIVERNDGTYSLKRFTKRFDAEEQVEYIVQSLPDPPGIFADLKTAIDEARRILKRLER